MRVTSITATKESILIAIDNPEQLQDFWVREQSPTYPAKRAMQYSLARCRYCEKSSVLEIPRYEGNRDRIFSRFTVWNETATKKAEGIRFITDFTEDAHAFSYPYKVSPSKKGTHAHGEDARKMGVCHATFNVNLPQLFSPVETANTIPYDFEGKRYYIRKATVESYDKSLEEYAENGINVSMIVLNSPKVFGADNNPLMNALATHPTYNPDGFISAFDVETEDGLGFYKAYLNFLAARYMDESALHGRITGFIIGNEVDLMWDWNNVGETTVEKYVKEYTITLRIGWLTAQKYAASARAYISLAHFFNTAANAGKPNRFFKGRQILDLLNEYATKEGNFGWNVAYHPYCESFHFPDFWNDRCATFNFGTPRITFRNLEMIPAYISQEQFLYKGEPRRIIFSEQGFHSFDERTEEIGFAAFCLAYKKIEKQPLIESFIYHAYIDNPHEFGLNLGTRKYSGVPGVLGEAKPLWHAFCAMGTEDEAAALERAKAIVGEKVWNDILNPQISAHDPDTSKDREFGGFQSSESVDDDE